MKDVGTLKQNGGIILELELDSTGWIRRGQRGLCEISTGFIHSCEYLFVLALLSPVRANEANVNALDSARAMMSSRGYVVVGIPAHESMPLETGASLTEFGGVVLKDHFLIVLSRTTRKDWDSQFVALFGDKKDNNIHARSSRYFRCVLGKTLPQSANAETLNPSLTPEKSTNTK